MSDSKICARCGENHEERDILNAAAQEVLNEELSDVPSSDTNELDEFIDYWGALDEGQEDIDRTLMRKDLEQLIATKEQQARIDEREKAVLEAQLEQRQTEKAEAFIIAEGLDGYKCAIRDVLLDHKDRLKELKGDI